MVVACLIPRFSHEFKNLWLCRLFGVLFFPAFYILGGSQKFLLKIFLFILFKLGNFYVSIFRFTDSFLCNLHYSIMLSDFFLISNIFFHPKMFFVSMIFFLIPVSQLRLPIHSFITSTFSFTIVSTVNLCPFIIPPSGISTAGFRWFSSPSHIFLVEVEILLLLVHWLYSMIYDLGSISSSK